MDTIYKTYDRFIEAAKKFPRWNNTRRRPTTSVGGALLRSIIEEIGKVEDAIIEYKKDFFIVNYVGKEDKIIDYLYSSHVGNIEDISKFKLLEPSLEVTNNVEEFYKDSDNLAYYQNGYVVLKNKAAHLLYSYNGYKYKTEIEKFHVWNIFDEFAWWSGITRFENEDNKTLLIRTVNQFHKRPNSSESGLKNLIYDVISGNDYIDKNDIVFEQPDEDNLYLKNDDGEILYEEISKFNRDIARTKQWDVDYWDNTFRSLKYIAHPWDAEVKEYKDGVGYNDSLHVSSLEDLNTDASNTATIYGYKKSTAKIEEYIKKNNISQNLDLKLTRYNDIINPLYVQYKIEASNLTEIDTPDQIFVDSYKTSKRELTYSIDSLYESKESGIDIVPRNKLESNQQYVLKLLPQSDSFSTMEIAKCELKYKNGSQNLLSPKGNFKFNSKGLFTNGAVLFHADSITELNSSSNLSDYRYGGLTLTDKNKPGSCEIDVTDVAKNKSQPLTVSTSCQLYNIMMNPTYVKVQGFTLVNGSYISGKSSVDPSIITIELKCRDLEFDIDKGESTLSSGYVNIETYIENQLDSSHTFYNISVGQFKKYSLTQFQMKNVRVVIKRNTTTAIKVSNIRTSRYDLKIVTSEGVDISPTVKESVMLPKHEGKYYLDITIENYGQTNPVINCIHIGANLNILTSVYSVKIDTTDLEEPELIIESNCRADVYLQTNQKEPIDFSVNSLYVNNTTEYQAIYLNLSDFKEIYCSSPELKYYNGRPYITLKPGDNIDTIVLYGSNEILQQRNTVKNLLNLQLGDKLYLNKNLKKFLKKNGDKESLLNIDYSMCATKNTDTYKIWSSKYKNIEVCFVSNSLKSVESITGAYSGVFEYAYIYDKDSATYVAYNGQNIIKNITDDINITKNFSPTLPSNLYFMFEIKDPASRSGQKFTVSFEDGNKWSSSISKKIRVETTIDLSNSSVFNTTIKNLNQNFILSNNIPLADTYTVNEEEIDLAKYIIEPPEHFNILYDPVTVSQERDEDGSVMYVEEDGFNKLLYSNIQTVAKILIKNKEIDKADYTVLDKEGIICWNSDEHVGKPFKAVYTYRKPKYMTCNDISYLYDKVGYQIDTLEKVEMVNDYIVGNADEGTIIDIDFNYFQEKPEKIAVSCSNPCFVGIVNNNQTITIKKIANDDSIVIHNGYYYIDGKEYWYFADKYQKDVDRIDGVKTFNVEKYGKQLIFKAEAINYLKNSKMLCNSQNVHCICDFKNYKLIPNINALNHIGACDSFTNWYSFDMNITLGNNFDGETLVFANKSESAYALLDITYALRTNRYISCFYNGSLKFALGREILIYDQQVSKSLFVERYKDFIPYDSNKVYYDGTDLDLDNYRYYIIVTGSGTLIETMVTENNDYSQNYQRVPEKLGLTITEETVPGVIVNVDFNPVGMTYDGLELSKDFVLRTGTTADWGVTKIEDIDLKNLKTTAFLYRNDGLVAQADQATAKTNAIHLSYRKAIRNLFIKINEYPYENFKNFDVVVYGSNNGVVAEDVEIYRGKNKNLFQIPHNVLTDYIKIKITSEDKKIIKNVTLFAQYNVDLESPRVTDIDYGTCTSKIYDVGIQGRYIVKEVDYDLLDGNNVRIQVRGLRNSNGENVWTGWYDIDQNHEFDQYRYFQFKTIIRDRFTKVRINKFVFEVKG